MRAILLVLMFLAADAQAANNPGAIKYGPLTREFEGLADPPSINGYCNFVDIVSGVRAIAKVLMTYQRDYGLNTIGKIIERYAPEGVDGNNTTEYVVFVSGRLGVVSDEVINVFEYIYMRPVVDAIIRFENVGPFPTDQETIRGIEAAGIERNGVVLFYSHPYDRRATERPQGSLH